MQCVKYLFLGFMNGKGHMKGFLTYELVLETNQPF